MTKKQKVKKEKLPMLTINRKEFIEYGTQLFGKDKNKWKYVCPACGHVQTGEDFKKIDVDPDDVVHFSCIGRWLKDKHDWFKGNSPCNYTLGGLFGIGVFTVQTEDKKFHTIFELEGIRELIHKKGIVMLGA